MIFVDTGAWFARFVPSDPAHAAVTAAFKSNGYFPLITTDLVISETLTLLRARGERHRALEAGLHFFERQIADIHCFGPDDLIDVWHIFHRFHDKNWSFTDCASKLIINRLHLTRALSLDHHFRQFGDIEVFP